MRRLPPRLMSKASELASQPYRPPEIVQLKEEIEGEIRAAELHVSVTGSIDFERVRKIVAMKMKLDNLYISWVEGKIG